MVTRCSFHNAQNETIAGCRFESKHAQQNPSALLLVVCALAVVKPIGGEISHWFIYIGPAPAHSFLHMEFAVKVVRTLNDSVYNCYGSGSVGAGSVVSVMRSVCFCYALYVVHHRIFDSIFLLYIFRFGRYVADGSSINPFIRLHEIMI